jgi:hypothetical protein
MNTITVTLWFFLIVTTPKAPVTHKEVTYAPRGPYLTEAACQDAMAQTKVSNTADSVVGKLGCRAKVVTLP